MIQVLKKGELPKDMRPLDEIEFAIDITDASARLIVANRVRAYFATWGAKTAQDIAELGCTGAYCAARGGGNNIDTDRLVGEVRWVRENMGGSLVGLPCYVPGDRFCLIHNTIGALNIKGQFTVEQKPRFPEAVQHITRDLTAAEKASVELIEAARHSEHDSKTGRMQDALDKLTGKKLPDGWTSDLIPGPQSIQNPGLPPVSVPAPVVVAHASDDGEIHTLLKLVQYSLMYDVGREPIARIINEADGVSERVRKRLSAILDLEPEPAAAAGIFLCPEDGHQDAPKWHCRYCVAQILINGPGGHAPQFVITPASEGTTAVLEDAGEIAPEDIDTVISKYGRPGAADTVALFVKVARWSRVPAVDSHLVRDK